VHSAQIRRFYEDADEVHGVALSGRNPCRGGESRAHLDIRAQLESVSMSPLVIRLYFAGRRDGETPVQAMEHAIKFHGWMTGMRGAA
jgi:hypothetical protein